MKYPLVVIAFTAIFLSPASHAETNDTEVAAIREQLLELSQRLDLLEQSNIALRKTNAELQAANSQTVSSVNEVADQTQVLAVRVGEQADASSWADKIRIKGDFRYRMENIQETGKSDRDRQRIRARAAIIATPQEGLEVGLGIASGDDDPLTTNQTLGGGSSTKGLNLDLAYFSWSGLENTKIIAGKFKNILHKSGGNTMLWDGDWNPEGFGLQWGNGNWFGNLLGSWIESDSKGGGSEFSYVIQGGIKTEFNSGASLKAGLTYTDFGTAGSGSFFGDADNFYGNSFDPQTNTYLYNYEELEVFADFSFTLLNRPALLFVDYVQNQDAGALDTAYAVGLTLGTAKSYGDWSLGWVYRDVEADAILGLVADSDFAGGGTDGKGHIFNGAYGLGKYLNASVSYYANEFDVSSGAKKDHDRFQLNLNFKY